MGATYPSIAVLNATKFAFPGEGNLPQRSAIDLCDGAASQRSREQAYLVLRSASPGWGHAAFCRNSRCFLLLSTSEDRRDGR